MTSIVLAALYLLWPQLYDATTACLLCLGVRQHNQWPNANYKSCIASLLQRSPKYVVDLFICHWSCCFSCLIELTILLVIVFHFAIVDLLDFTSIVWVYNFNDHWVQTHVSGSLRLNTFFWKLVVWIAGVINLFGSSLFISLQFYVIVQGSAG